MGPHRYATDGAITRRMVLAGGAAASIPAPALATASAALWDEYSARYVNPDGRGMEDGH